jgi:hypothetical protein
MGIWPLVIRAWGEQADQSNLTPDEAAHDLFLAHLAAAADAVI